MFFLDDVDLALVAARRGDHNRLGFSLLLTTTRYVGSFLADPLDVPTVVVDYLADQLGIADSSCVKQYLERRSTRFEHAEEIKTAYGLRDFTSAEAELKAWVDARAWTTGDGPKAIFTDATVWLREHDVVYRRDIKGIRNLQEGRHALAEKIFHGKKGQLYQRYQTGMEDQLGALGLVLNCVVLWNTSYLNAALDQLRAQGYPVLDDDVARLSPFIRRHLDVHGTYSFLLPELLGALRELRDPDANEQDDNE